MKGDRMKRVAERGSAMLITTVVVVVLAAIASVMMTQSVFNWKRTEASRRSDEAMLVCQAGLERARRALFLYRSQVGSWISGMDGGTQWDDILTYSDPNGVNGPNKIVRKDDADFLGQVAADYQARRLTTVFTTYRLNPNAPGAGTTPETAPKFDANVIFGQSNPFRTGGYHILVYDNDDDGNLLHDTDRILYCLVTATMDDGSQRQLEGILQFDPPTFVPQHALLSGGDMTVGGNAIVNGTSGSIHSNEDLEFLGGAFSISGSSTSSGSADAPGTGGQPVQPIPEIKPSAFENKATIMLDNGGKVWNRDAGGNWQLVTTVSGNQNWNGFKYNAQGWRFQGNGQMPNEVYYVKTDILINGNASAQQASFLVDGSMNLSGGASFTPHASMQNVTVLARGDIGFSGNFSGGSVDGLWAAHEQVKIQGNPTIHGAVVAEDAENIKNGVTGMQESLQDSGSAIVTYDGNMTTLIETASNVKVKQVRRNK